MGGTQTSDEAPLSSLGNISEPVDKEMCVCVCVLEWIHWVPVKSSINKAQKHPTPGSFRAQDQEGGMSGNS